MTWSLFSEKAWQVYNCLSTCVKIALDVSRATRTYLADNLLSGGLPSIRSSILARFCKFFQSLRMSCSLAVRVVANITCMDIRSVTGSNLYNIEKEIKLDPVKDVMMKVKAAILGLRSPVPLADAWRISCLRKYLDERHLLRAGNQDTEEIDKLIESICILGLLSPE